MVGAEGVRNIEIPIIEIADRSQPGVEIHIENNQYTTTVKTGATSTATSKQNSTNDNTEAFTELQNDLD